eukprot:2430479-Amphidinium_carterae.1
MWQVRWGTVSSWQRYGIVWALATVLIIRVWFRQADVADAKLSQHLCAQVRQLTATAYAG